MIQFVHFEFKPGLNSVHNVVNLSLQPKVKYLPAYAPYNIGLPNGSTLADQNRLNEQIHVKKSVLTIRLAFVTRIAIGSA